MRYNRERAWARSRKVVITPELLEELGATGKTLDECAKLLGYRQGSTLGTQINKNLTNRQAFDKGRLKAKNGKQARKV